MNKKQILISLSYGLRTPPRELMKPGELTDIKLCNCATGFMPQKVNRPGDYHGWEK